MIWTCNDERTKVCRKKDDENGVTRKEEKRETKMKIFRYWERQYGEVDMKEMDVEEKDHTLWLPLFKQIAKRSYHNIMTGKKSLNKSTSSKQANEHEAVTDIVKSILVDTDILQETMISFKFFGKVFLESTSDCLMIMKNFKSDIEFLEIIASKRVNQY